MTEHLDLDKALPELEELFERLFVNLLIGAFVVQNRKFRLFNPQFQKILGYTSGELLAMDCLEPVFPEDRKVVRENAAKCLQGKRLLPYQYRFVNKDGVTYWAMEMVIPGKWRGKRAALGYLLDIGERKEAEKTLRESEEKLRQMCESVTDGITVTDLNGIITQTNKRIAEIHAVGSRNELLGKSAFEFIAQDDRERAVENMRFYISQITRAQEEERRRIARELHDDMVQSLAALSLDIQAIGRTGGQLSDETRQLLEQLRLKTDDIIEAVRRFSHELRPELLDQLGLLPALELLTQKLSDEGETFVRLELTGSERRISMETELVLFRIAQEALRNVSKHSHAKEVVVSLAFSEKKVKLDIIDNGGGFELSEALGDFVGAGRLGLIGMQERARLLDANFAVKSEPGKGTVVTVEVVR